ncbi:MAG: hypothetical protein RLZZ471_998, partial [Actinomycetota bacterium]
SASEILVAIADLLMTKQAPSVNSQLDH